LQVDGTRTDDKDSKDNETVRSNCK